MSRVRVLSKLSTSKRLLYELSVAGTPLFMIVALIMAKRKSAKQYC